MRVGIVCPYDLAAHGGVQQICRELAAHLEAGGDQATLMGPSGRIMTVTANRSSVPLSLDPRLWSETRRRLATVDVVHVHEPFIPLVSWAALSVDKPLVATFHADPAPWTRRLYRLAGRLGARLLNGALLTAASPVAASAILRRWGDVEMIPNAIDTASYAPPVERNRHRVVFLGRDDPRKGLEVLLRAWPAVRDSLPDAELVVLGAIRPPMEGVEFRSVDDEEKRRVLASAAVMVAPNLGGESFGIVVAEGMAAGCAVVASDLPAFRSVLDVAGVFFPIGDHQSLARELSRLLADPERALRLGSQARESAARFDWSSVLPHYRAAYESAVKRHRTTIDVRKE